MYRLTRIWAFGLAIAAIIVGCASPQPGQGTRQSDGPVSTGPKRLNAAVNTADPLILRSSAGGPFGGSANGIDALEHLVHAGAAIRDSTDLMRPQIAEAVPSAENGLWKVMANGRMETTLKIRPGAQWHDGTPFTSDDFAFTLKVAQDPEMVAFGGHPGLAIIDGWDAPDPSTFIVRWKSPFTQADTMFSTEFAMPMPKHLLERTYTENKGAVVQLPYWTDQFIGAGPFKLKEWNRGSYMTLTAFDQYVGGRPKIDEIVVNFIPDANTMVANMLASEIEVNLGRGLSIEQAIQVRDQWREGRMEVGKFNWVVAYPQFIDPSPAVLADARMRKALMHALNRQEMADELQFGATPVAHSVIDTSLPQYQSIDNLVVRYEYDVRRAGQMIEGLGYTKGPDGMFRDSAGVPLRVEIRTTGEQEIQTKSVLSVADYWQRAGVGVDTMVLGVQRRTDRAYRATRPAFEVLRTPNGDKGLRRAYSTETPLPENNFTKSGNNARYMSAEFDTLLDKYFSTIPMPERVRVLGQIVQHASDQVTTMGFFFGAEPTLISNRIVGAGPRAAQDSTNAWNAAEWTLK